MLILQIPYAKDVGHDHLENSPDHLPLQEPLCSSHLFQWGLHMKVPQRIVSIENHLILFYFLLALSVIPLKIIHIC